MEAVENDKPAFVEGSKEKNETASSRRFHAYDSGMDTYLPKLSLPTVTSFLRTGCSGLVFIRIYDANIDVMDMCEKVFAEIKETKSTMYLIWPSWDSNIVLISFVSKFLLRLIPIQKVCEATMTAVESALKALVAERLNDDAWKDKSVSIINPFHYLQLCLIRVR